MTGDVEYVGDLTFDPSDIKSATTLDDWLDRARREYRMSRIAIAFLNMSDAELERHVNSFGDTDEKRGRLAMDLVEWFQGWIERYRAGEKVTTAAWARLVVVGERLCGREVVEEAAAIAGRQTVH